MSIDFVLFFLRFCDAMLEQAGAKAVVFITGKGDLRRPFEALLQVSV